VVYEYGGKQYSIQLPNDPGQYLPVQVTPSVVAAPPMPGNTIVTSTPVITRPMVVTSITAPPLYAPRMVGPSFYAAPAASFYYGYGHHGHYRHEHERRHWQ
jgi:hypothetical protein